jgi:DNA polymerase elongation subunit (family B)
MSYIDALYDRTKDRIHIVGRRNEERYYQEYPAEYRFYYDDPNGKYRSIFNTPVSRFQTRNSKEFRRELRVHSGKKIYESDVNPVLRCLEENFKNQDSPKLHTVFFDIEVDFDPLKGYSRPEDPFNPITAVSLYLDWLDQLITLVIPPQTLNHSQAQTIAQDYENCFVCANEQELLNTFLELIDDADVLSGWNSEGFDIPYMVMRTTRVLSRNDTRRFCLWDQLPRQRVFERFGAENITFDLIGRVHMDYMQLYRKYTYEERHSYSLDAIGEYENVGSKVAYQGTLDQLYNREFGKFIQYNREDVALIARLDKKLKFLDLANTLAHENTVLLPATMGAVAVTEQAIINEAHDQGMVVPNRPQHNDSQDTQAAGAYVAYPKKGIHEYVGSVDINSLYPSTIRALNMGPETIVGQLRQDMTQSYIKERIDRGRSFAEAWEGLFACLEYSAVMERRVDQIIVIDWENGEQTQHSAAEIYNIIFHGDNHWMLSANGTIFTAQREGIIPGLLKRWYSERKELQAKLKESIKLENKIEEEYWDKRQLVKKINLNSLYGAILNPGCRFFDKRIGQSTTLCGRSITQHMTQEINYIIDNDRNHLGRSIIYNDTDSCYFSAWPVLQSDIESGKMQWNKDIAVDVYDNIANLVNNSFSGFMSQAFNCSSERGSVIKCGREIVAERGLFITKKRYALLYYDKEGRRYDQDQQPGKIKATGLDLKRSDTPKVVQDFLSSLLWDVLTGSGREHVIERVKEFKLVFAERPAWEKGTPKRVNNLTSYSQKEQQLGRANMPGHVRAAINWNNLRRMHSDNYSMQIVDGMKTIVCKLKSNPLGFTSVGYPTDETRLPEWFKELPFDDAEMEVTIVDQKIENLLGGLNWKLKESTNTASTFNMLFELEE